MSSPNLSLPLTCDNEQPAPPNMRSRSDEQLRGAYGAPPSLAGEARVRRAGVVARRATRNAPTSGVVRTTTRQGGVRKVRGPAADLVD